MGLNNGFAITLELKANNEVSTDVQGMAKINKPRNAQNSSFYQTQFDFLYNGEKVSHSSITVHHDSTYQPGGTLLIVARSTAGRAQFSGNNNMGRFCWHALRGKQDRRIIFIKVYSMCHVNSDNPVPYMVYTQQSVAMREVGVINLNPRRQQL